MALEKRTIIRVLLALAILWVALGVLSIVLFNLGSGPTTPTIPAHQTKP